MRTGASASVLGPLHEVFDSGTLHGLDDTALLAHYRHLGDERAFEALVARHGPMVLGVCRRTLRDPHAVDDAFQATFLVFVRKAPTIRRPDRLGPWLFGVAYRVASRARRLAADQRTREGSTALADPPDRPRSASDDELRQVLDEELSRLPERYRTALVLCALEGLTHDEAAARLGWPVGTVRSRLARGREQLRGRLSRRGFAPALLASGRFESLLAPAPAVPPAVIDLAVQALPGTSGKLTTAAAVSGPAVALAEGVLNAMRLARIQTLLAGLLAAAALGTGSALLATQPGESDRPTPNSDAVPKRTQDRELRPATEPSVDPFAGSAAATRNSTVSPRELRARLAQAQERVRVRLRSLGVKAGEPGREALADAKGDVAIIEAQIADETERLEDERELLEAQREVQAAMVAQASIRVRSKTAALARYRKLAEQHAVSNEEVAITEANEATERAGLKEKEAELRIIDLRIKQVLRRLRRLNPNHDTMPSDRDEEGPTKPARPESALPPEAEPQNQPVRLEVR